MEIRRVDNKYLPERIVDQDEESVKQYRDSLQLFGEACYLSLLLRDQEENQDESQEEYN